jgi:hypothetical protein
MLLFLRAMTVAGAQPGRHPNLVVTLRSHIDVRSARGDFIVPGLALSKPYSRTVVVRTAVTVKFDGVRFECTLVQSLDNAENPEEKEKTIRFLQLARPEGTIGEAKSITIARVRDGPLTLEEERKIEMKFDESRADRATLVQKRKAYALAHPAGAAILDLLEEAKVAGPSADVAIGFSTEGEPAEMAEVRDLGSFDVKVWDELAE